ncbi:putative F-box-like domain superfamily protein [Tanacetum coccineum]
MDLEEAALNFRLLFFNFPVPLRLRVLSLAFGPEVTDASVVAISKCYLNLELLDLSGSSISDSGIGMICNVFPDTLKRLHVSQCSYIASSGRQFATAQLPHLELMDCGMTICEPGAQSPLCEANSDSDSQSLYLNCPNLSELNSNSCKALLLEKLVLQCSKLESVHVVGCPDMVVQADSATHFLNSDFDSKMDKLDQKVALLNLIVEDLEFQFSKSLVDHPNNSRMIEFIMRVDMEMIFEKRIILSKGFDLTYTMMTDEETQEKREFGTVKRIEVVTTKSYREELDIVVKGTDEEKDEEILNQDVSEVNVLKVIKAELDSISEKSREFKVKKDTLFDFKTFDIPKVDDKEKSTVSVFEDYSRNDMPNHKLDEAPSFSLGPEFDDFSIEEINQTNVNDANITINLNIESGIGFSETEADCSQKEKQSLDRILKVSFRPESKVDVLKEDIKLEIKDASIRMQPKRKASVAWYLKSPFKVRGSALNSNTNTLSQAKFLAADTLFIMDKESDPL